MEISDRSWRFQHNVLLAPRRPVIPHCSITLIRLNILPEKEGGSGGCSPWIASPSGGSEGVTLIIAAENNRVIGK
jgi:hypothetical protein